MTALTTAGSGSRPNRTDALFTLPPRSPFVHIAVKEHLLRVAVESTLRLERITILDTDESGAYVISDDLQRVGPNIILLGDESPMEAYQAVLAFTHNRVCAIASIRRPEALPMVIEAATHGLAVMPPSLVAAAFNAPRLSDQHVRVLGLTIEGLTNGAIGIRLGMSEAAVKRAISLLLRSFGAATRTELVRRASNIGFRSTTRSMHPSWTISDS